MASLKKRFAFMRFNKKSNNNNDDTDNSSSDEENQCNDTNNIGKYSTDLKKLRVRWRKDREKKQITLKCGNQMLLFKGGKWHSVENDNEIDEMERILQEYSEVKEENNMLKLKVQVLMHMLTEKQMEINQLRGTHDSELESDNEDTDSNV